MPNYFSLPSVGLISPSNLSLLSVGLISLTGMRQAQAILIDHFDSPAGGQMVSIMGGVAGSSASDTALGLAGVLGGGRTIQAEVQQVFAGGNTTVMAANYPGISPDSLNFASDVNVDSIGKAIWDANGAGLNTAFGAGAMELTDVSNDLATTYTIVLETFGGGSSSATQVLGVASFNVDLIFPSASFAGTANWGDIDKITLIVDTARSGDAQISAFEFNESTNVPDGGSCALLLASGLTSLTVLFRKASQPQK